MKLCYIWWKTNTCESILLLFRDSGKVFLGCVAYKCLENFHCMCADTGSMDPHQCKRKFCFILELQREVKCSRTIKHKRRIMIEISIDKGKSSPTKRMLGLLFSVCPLPFPPMPVLFTVAMFAAGSTGGECSFLYQFPLT